MTQRPRESELTQQIEINAPARRIFQAISTADGLGKWWSYYLSGPDPESGEVHLKWPRAGHRAKIRLAEAKEPVYVEWSVVEHRPLKEWDGSTIRISLEESGSHKTRLNLVHHGLTPDCECFQACSTGWGYLVGQIKKLVEQGYT